MLTVLLRSAARPARLTELIHRAIPYPVVLWSEQDGAVSLSLAHKRWSQGEAGEVVIEDVRRTAPFADTSPTKHEAEFLASLALSKMRTRDLYTLYQGWLDRMAALETASITGTFVVPETAERANAQREALAVHARLQRELAIRRAKAKKEKQLNRRVDLNLEIKRLEARIARHANDFQESTPAMKKLTAQDAETRSSNLVAENISRIKSLFPEAFTEGKVDFDVLRQLLGDAIDDREEKYGLNWHGKRRARQLTLTPSTGTLRPCPEDSVDWDTTQNLMIEGDNLEVLKLLQKSYAGKVKLIYIDPPYNTGNDFVYPDDYRDNIKNYLELTGQADGEGRRISSNTEASGRFHTDWLNMMYPRLQLARNLLREDGMIFISIDDNEVDESQTSYAMRFLARSAS